MFCKREDIMDANRIWIIYLIGVFILAAVLVIVS